MAKRRSTMRVSLSLLPRQQRAADADRHSSHSLKVIQNKFPIMTIHAQRAQQHLLPQPQILGSESTNPAWESGQRIRKNVARACEACKVKKRRCNGKYPCWPCLDKGLCCRFRTRSDRRRERGICKTF